MTFRLGLTGSIGMGKSTTAAMFADAGCALWDADAAVHRAYAPGGPAIGPVGALVPGAIKDHQLDRVALREAIRQSPALLKQIEAIVHPLVQQDRKDFLAAADATIAVLDIPLLFETGGEAAMDAVACVNVPRETQRARVLARGTMSEADFDLILSRQMPNAEKCARATYVIETDTLDHARAQVQRVVRDIERGLAHA
ncbi:MULTISPECIES: dephospho-CoA kinase [unclassified Marinovum]